MDTKPKKKDFTEQELKFVEFIRDGTENIDFGIEHFVLILWILMHPEPAKA